MLTLPVQYTAKFRKKKKKRVANESSGHFNSLGATLTNYFFIQSGEKQSTK